MLFRSPGWAVTFEGGRFREVASERIPPGSPPIGARLGGRFDQRILALSPGASVTTVERKLGPPDAIEVAYYNARPIRKTFFYGAWELEIENERLAMRKG